MPHVDDGQLHAWLDGETRTEEVERIDRHLATCDECRGRLDEVARVHALAGELVDGAREANAPAWAELVARAQATRDANPAAADPVAAEAIRTRRVGTPRLLTSGLAWAATLVLAFGLGWYAGFRPRVEPLGEQSLRPGAALPSEADPPAEEKRADVAEREISARESVAKQLSSAEAEAPTPADGDTEVSGNPRASTMKASAAPAGQRLELAESSGAAAQTEPPRVAERRMLDQAEAAAVPQDRLQPAPAPERQRVFADDEAADLRVADAVATGAVVDTAAIAQQDVAGWLGRAPLRLEDATFAGATVAPLAAGRGNTARPAVWMLFDDPSSGARVTVAQRRWQPDANADQAARPTDLESAVLTVNPDGTLNLSWITGDGYLVFVTADVEEATLRALAQRLR